VTPGEASLPEFVVAPAHPASSHGDTSIVFEVRESPRGNVVPVFSDVRRLVAALGPAQPWVVLPLIKIRELAASGGVHEVVLDPEVESGAWRWSYEDLVTLQESES
jgi:hypothetical protein